MAEQTSINHKCVVAKSNELVGQMAKFELSELRLIAFCLAHYDSRKPDNRSFVARVADLTELFPINESSAYRVVRQTVLGLGKKPLEFQEGTRRHYWNWFSGFTYDESNGEFEFKITPEIQPYLLELSGNFTKYRLGDVYQFKAASTWKMYELLKRWLIKGSWEVNLDELRLSLGVAGKYPRWNNFKQRLIDPALDEINEHSDILVEYLPYKRGRRIIGIEFNITAKTPEDAFTVSLETQSKELYKLLLDAGLNCKTAQGIIDKARLRDKTEALLKKVPAMVVNAAKRGANTAKYVTGAIADEIDQLDLFEDKEQPKKVLDHEEALSCWQAKKKSGKTCEVRVRGEAGQRKKCQTCLEKILVEDFGI